eukprot:TRINITY_DN691_c0_g1_i1.p1 TRINITY_DN691_c0_g1~~TRINITY_DN691_c0_g1_i1.p1  ORF type:complete len:510 (-),score=179.78 TRINITY_DN691_c0_g1_i1:39-1568(-)
MLVLFETPAGYALFKVLNEAKLKNVDNLYKEFERPEGVVKLQTFSRFKSTADAVKATTSLLNGKLSSNLKKFLSKSIVDKELKDTLVISDPKIGSVIKEKLSIKVTSGEEHNELFRGIRAQLSQLITEVSDADMKAMSLGLSHSLSRYKIKFSPEKVDTMIVQAVALLDDLDKELNTYSMRVREWYGWHFPELSKIIPENVLFAKTVKHMGFRTNAADLDFTDFLPEELDKELKEAAQISMGTEISDDDIANISTLCDQVISLSEYRDQLYEYLKNRMAAIAPNLTIMVGELVGARLIAHAGSLLSLAKHPASTVQILGAEKALFRALKSKHATPKYGLIYHASLIGQAPPKLKGKISRMLAAKTALSVRFDSFGEGDNASNTDIGTEGRAKVEAQLKSLEAGQTHRISGTGKSQNNHHKYDKNTGANNMQRVQQNYSSKNDAALNNKKVETPKSAKKTKPVEEEPEEEEEQPKAKKSKQKRPREEEEVAEEEPVEEEKPKKKKKSSQK